MKSTTPALAWTFEDCPWVGRLGHRRCRPEGGFRTSRHLIAYRDPLREPTAAVASLPCAGLKRRPSICTACNGGHRPWPHRRGAHCGGGDRSAGHRACRIGMSWGLGLTSCRCSRPDRVAIGLPCAGGGDWRDLPAHEAPSVLVPVVLAGDAEGVLLGSWHVRLVRR